ncbi:MAG: DUF599 family protein [Hyphomicrobiaceae bacterium]
MAGFEWLDVAALCWFVIVVIGYQSVTQLPVFYDRSITGATQRHRIAWMRAMLARDNRSSDAILLGTLSQGNAFFASTCAIAIGGLTAIVGSGDKADAFLQRLPYAAKASPLLWEIKVILLISVFVYAFFKFAWAFRLTHYTAIMIGAIPNPGVVPDEEMDNQALNAAQISGLAAEHANGGLRAFYHAAAVLTWFFNPVLFMIATGWVGLILLRRDFFSRSKRILAGEI